MIKKLMQEMSNPSEYLDALHIRNMFDAITHNKKLNSDIDSDTKVLCLLTNIAQSG